MLDRLPVELLAHVLSFVDYPSLVRFDKPTSLYDCCLVSKRIKDVAQPLLWRSVAVETLRGSWAVKREVAAGELGRHVRVLEASGHEVKASELRTLVQSLPGLAEARLREFEAPQMNAVDELLPHLQHLERLDLFFVDFLNITTLVPFHRLSSLSLCEVHTTESFLSSLLQPQYLPLLRSLRLSNLSGDRDVAFLPSFSNAFLRQLDILQLPLEAIHLASLEVIQHPTTLFSGTIQDLREYVFEGIRPAPVKNLHVRPAGLHEDLLSCDDNAMRYLRYYTRNVLGKLAAFIPSSGTTALLLPIPLQQPALTAECDELLAACRTKGVEVLWDEERDAGTEDFNEEFRRLVIKKKRNEAGRAS